MNLDYLIFGIRLWVILYLTFSVLSSVFVVCWFFREKIRKRFYLVKCPEMLIKIVIHYEGNMFKEFWRIIPVGLSINVAGQSYNFEKEYIHKSLDVFADIKENQWFISVFGKNYKFDKPSIISKRFRSFPEIHYFYNVPVPIRFDAIKGKVEFSADALETFKENDLLKKLLTLEDEKKLLMFLLIMQFITIAVGGFNLAKTMGWLK